MLTTNKQQRHVAENNMAVSINLQGGGVGGLNKPSPLLPFFLYPNQITASWLVSCVKATNKGEKWELFGRFGGKRQLSFLVLNPSCNLQCMAVCMFFVRYIIWSSNYLICYVYNRRLLRRQRQDMTRQSLKLWTW